VQYFQSACVCAINRFTLHREASGRGVQRPATSTDATKEGMGMAEQLNGVVRDTLSQTLDRGVLR
jgi:hypothetical protein